MVQTQVTAQGWPGSTPEATPPDPRLAGAGGSLAVASSTPATPLFSRLQDREAIGMAKAYLEMRQSDLNAVNAALAVLAAAK